MISMYPDCFNRLDKFSGEPYNIELVPSYSPNKMLAIPEQIHQQANFTQQLAEMQAADMNKPVGYAWIN